MKKITLLGCLIFILSGFVIAQNEYPTATNSSVKLDGGNLYLIRPDKDGGWARGLHYFNTYSDGRWAGIGLYGSGESAESIYITHGGNPWNSDKGIHIQSNGHTGVGTRYPISPFTVSSNSPGPISSIIDTETDETTANPYMAFYYGSSPTRLGYVGYGSSNTKDLYVTNDKGGLRFRDQTGEVMSVRDGKVGIGTGSPGYPLTIHGNAIEGASPQTDNTNKGLRFMNTHYSTSEDPFVITMGYASASTNQVRIGGGTSMGNAATLIRFYTGSNTTTNFGNEQMRITSNGNVGIGTTNPGAYKLAVNGTIRAKEVKVESDWADFVFEPGYKLKSLEEVDAYILENKHLPDVPSAKQVETNGLSLGEMNKIVMQKIEELTLYMIEQNKRIEKLEAENEELREILTTKEH